MGIYLKNLVYAVGVVYHGEKMNGRVNNQTRFSRYKDNNGNHEIIYYTLNKKSRFTYTTQNARGQRIQRTGFHGEIRFKNDLFMPKASFVDFEELGDAAMTFECAHRISHPRVLRAHFYSEYRDNEDSDGMFLVCFEKFDGFLNDVPEPYLTFLVNPSYLYQPGDTVQGNPNIFVQAQIRELNVAVIKMHAGIVSSSNLNLIDGYFWCEHDLTIKIMVDIHIALDDVTKLRRWDSIRTRNEDYLITDGLLHFARPGFSGNDRFIQSLSSPDIMARNRNRLAMISNHPFLEDDAQVMMEKFSNVYNGVKSFDMKSADLVSALAGGFLDDEFIDKVQGTWDISTMDPGFSTVFYYRNKQNNYNVTSMVELLKFIRNVYEHRNQTSLSVDVIFNDIQRKWPHLLYRMHELLSGR